MLESNPGKRNDLDAFKTAILASNSDMELFTDHTREFLRYFKAVQHIRGLTDGTRRVRPELVVYIGRPGVGKTTRIMSSCKDDDTHFQNDSGWWDGYRGQKTIVLDDFRGWIPLHLFLKLIDVVPLRLPIKGSFTPNIAAERVLISTNFLPCDWWKDIAENQQAAVTRRISKLILWDQDGEVQEYSSWEEFSNEGTVGDYRTFLANGFTEPILDPVL